VDDPERPSEGISTQTGQVGFRDFLEFVKAYGKTSSDAGYDARYDLNQNNRIELPGLHRVREILRPDRPIGGSGSRYLLAEGPARANLPGPSAWCLATTAEHQQQEAWKRLRANAGTINQCLGPYLTPPLTGSSVDIPSHSPSALRTSLIKPPELSMAFATTN